MMRTVTRSKMTDDKIADIREWACENLTEAQAGKVCGMLSEVSREEASLRDLVVNLEKAYAAGKKARQETETTEARLRLLEEENRRLRECISDAEENYRLERHEIEELHELCTDMYKSIGSMRTSFSEFVEFGYRMKKLGIRDGKSY